ncbi:MAG: hypothetical protein ETSY2_41530 [Candidatus Entotheonella gemina]|uniref:Uncharacterized protein n=1 Tax=Candidatus Entotheonella gemina TaxID=1429439 RepID=W4LNY9_9BACT|nr:MAG: hypothetical protein ETSY2_41530 [Candidatus Entotheonella gemina]
MINLRRIALVWALMACVALTYVTSAWSENKPFAIESFEAFQQHFNQHQGRPRLVLLGDPG